MPEKTALQRTHFIHRDKRARIDFQRDVMHGVRVAPRHRRVDHRHHAVAPVRHELGYGETRRRAAPPQSAAPNSGE